MRDVLRAQGTAGAVVVDAAEVADVLEIDTVLLEDVETEAGAEVAVALVPRAASE